MIVNTLNFYIETLQDKKSSMTIDMTSFLKNTKFFRPIEKGNYLYIYLL